MDSKFLKKQEEYFKSLMEEIRTKMSSFNGEVSNEGDVVDRFSGLNENNKNIKLNTRLSKFMKKIMHSLNKINNNTYGECEDCSCDIELSRLEARPTATLCIDCKEAQEAYERCTHKNKSIHQYTWINPTNKIQ